MKKILILTLGTGQKKNGTSSFDVIIEKGIDKLAQSYQSTKYQFDGKETVEDVSFVAEPLIENYHPDYIYILGTQNSVWTSFWINFVTKANLDEEAKSYAAEVIKPVWDIENDVYSFETEKRLAYQGKIQEVFEKFLPRILNVEKIRVILLPYGINHEELNVIYRTIFDQFENDFKEDERVLGEKQTYDVAFDITHSFRSLPIYNYAILNYFRQITSYEVNIREIYYGMFEARSINHDIAPIVKLGEITGLMNLTNAVAEFNNTGSVKALISFLDQVKEDNPSIDKMKDILVEFDWAAGANSGLELIQSIEKLNKLISENDESKGIYNDIKKALSKVLEKRVFEDLPYSLKDIKTAKNSLEYADYQLVLAKWYYDQHRYSQSACIACEAFRSYIMFLYARTKNIKDNLEWTANQDKRTNVNDDWFNGKKIKTSKGYEEEVTFLSSAKSLNTNTRKIRNTSAHILQRSGNKETLIEYITMMKEFQQYLKNKEKLYSFICIMENYKIKNIQQSENNASANKETKVIKTIDKSMVDRCKSKQDIKNLLLRNNMISKPAYIALRNKLLHYFCQGLKAENNTGKEVMVDSQLINHLASNFIAWNKIEENDMIHTLPFDAKMFLKPEKYEYAMQHKCIFNNNSFIIISCDSEERYNQFLVDLVCYKLIMNQVKTGTIVKNKVNYEKILDEFLR